MDSSTVYLSIVVPMYNEETVIDIFFERIIPILEDITPDYEIICVDDGSDDETFSLLGKVHDKNPEIKILNLSRNFGKELAMTAGIDHAAGQAVIPLDADLQDPPELSAELVEKWREGYDMAWQSASTGPATARRSGSRRGCSIASSTGSARYRFPKTSAISA